MQSLLYRPGIDCYSTLAEQSSHALTIKAPSAAVMSISYLTEKTFSLVNT